MDLTTFLLATVAVTAAATLQGSIGFGLGMLGSPLLMLIYRDFIPAPMLIAALVLTALLTRREWRWVEFSHLKWSLAGRLIGTAAAATVLLSVSADQMAVAFGVLVLLAVGMSASGLHPQLNPRTLFLAGGLSGFMGTSIAVGAPPMALVYQNESGPKVRGTLSAYFTVGVVMSLAGLATVGRFSRHEALLALALMPSILAGLWISRHTAAILDRGYTRPAVLVLSAAAGLAVLLREIL